MENLDEKKYSHIKGWGIDADPSNEPTYPMKKYTGDDHQRLNYEKPVQQPVNTEILHSNERPAVTAVFGVPNPPSGLSGVLRRYAFKYSEASFGHWIPLLLADRVNVVEGIIDDLKHGYVPDLFAEKGLKAELKFNKDAFTKRVLIRTAIVTAVIAAWYFKGRSSKVRSRFRR